MRRILGQCNQVDFASLEHLAATHNKLELVDTSTLTKKQILAFAFVKMTRDRGISWKLLRKVVQEVLFWGEDEDKVTTIEVQFFIDETRTGDIQLFKELWSK